MAPLCQVVFHEILIFDMNVISRNILLCRKSKESERSLAARIGVPWRTYMRWKKLEERPDISILTLEKIANELGVSPSWLAALEETQRVEDSPPDENALMQ